MSDMHQFPFYLLLAQAMLLTFLAALISASRQFDILACLEHNIASKLHHLQKTSAQATIIICHQVVNNSLQS